MFTVPSLLFVTLVIFTPSSAVALSPGALHYTVQEEVSPGTVIGDIYDDATLEDRYTRQDLENVQFQFLLTPTLNMDLEVTSGMLMTGGRIDRDTTCAEKEECAIRLDVVVSNPSRFLEIVTVVIEVLDENDNSPYFLDTVIVQDIPESATVGSSFVLPAAIDADTGEFGVARYAIMSNTSKFDLNTRKSLDGSVSLRLVLLETLDRERVHSYNVILVAYDGGVPSRSGSAEIRVVVQDANDNDPQFDNSTYDISTVENIAIGTKVLQVHARDRDTGLYGEVIYSLSTLTTSKYGSMFAINNHTGVISVVGELDHEKQAVVHLAVVAHDRGPNSVPAEAMVVIRLLDVNDNAPQITVNTIAAPGTDRAEVQEDAMLGTFVAYVTVSDPDSGDNGAFDCSLENDVFALQRRFVGEYQIVSTKPLNRERASVYQLDISCTDHGRNPRTELKTIFIHVRDVNDQTPVFTRVTYYASFTENNYVGTYVISVNATDGDSGANSEISYSLGEDAGDMFKIDKVSGRITAHSVFDRETISQIEFTVLAIDHGIPSNTGMYSKSIYLSHV